MKSTVLLIGHYCLVSVSGKLTKIRFSHVSPYPKLTSRSEAARTQEHYKDLDLILIDTRVDPHGRVLVGSLIEIRDYAQENGNTDTFI